MVSKGTTVSKPGTSRSLRKINCNDNSIIHVTENTGQDKLTDKEKKVPRIMALDDWSWIFVAQWEKVEKVSQVQKGINVILKGPMSNT